MTPIGCPHCRGEITYLPQYDGQVVACPHCGGHLQMVLPAVSQSPLPMGSGGSELQTSMQSPSTTGYFSSHAPPRRAPVWPALVAVGAVGCLALSLLALFFVLGGGSGDTTAQQTDEQVTPVAAHGESVATSAETPPIAASLGQAMPPTSAPRQVALPPTSVPATAASAPQTPDHSSSPLPSPIAAPPIETTASNPPQATPLAGATPIQPRPTDGMNAGSGSFGSPLPGNKTEPASPQPSPFARMANEAELPTLASSEPELVTPIDHSQPEEVRLRLVSTAADIPDKAIYYTQRSKEDPLRWDVLYTTDFEAEQPDSTRLGQFHVSSERVEFQWLEPFADGDLRRQLKNCVLVLEANNQLARVSLRKPSTAAPIKIDVSRDKFLQPYVLTDLPKKSRLFAEIQGYNFPVETPAGFISHTCSVGPDDEVKFSELDGAELGLRLAASGDGLNLTVAPRFRENNKLFPLSRPQLEKTKKATEISLQSALQTVAEKKAEIEQLQRNIRKVPSAQPGTAGAAGRAITLGKLEADIKRAANRIASLQRQIPAMEARLKAVPDVERFLDRLENRELTVQIYADCGDHRVFLVVASTPAQSGQNSSKRLRPPSGLNASVLR